MKLRQTLTACGLGFTMLLAGAAVAQQKPPQPPPVQNPFPMSSQKFRPFFDNIMSKLAGGRTPTEGDGKPLPSGWQDRMKFLASQAMEDGWVTEAEFKQIVSVMHGH